ncbi:hypothetical protein KY285_024651 [Solanum tuberosum]|nr:hypothetical protein KY285_024651 [Solanum tuberosum]
MQDHINIFVINSFKEAAMDVFGFKAEEQQPRFCYNYTITENGNRADSDFNGNRALSSLDAVMRECQKLLQQTKDDILTESLTMTLELGSTCVGAISDVDESPSEESASYSRKS